MSAGVVERIVASPWFTVPWAPYLLLDMTWRIRGVNSAYEEATAHSRERLLGEELFEVFPDNPADPTADGVANLSRSLETAVRTGRRHWMGYQRYDVPSLDDPASFTLKVWAPVNVPITEDGEFVAVLHHVQDVTDTLWAEHLSPKVTTRRPDFDQTIDDLMLEFPAVPRGTLLGIVTDSERVVLDALGRPHRGRATELARIRIEVRTGHRAQPRPDVGE